jgi:hypothetical protein
MWAISPSGLMHPITVWVLPVSIARIMPVSFLPSDDDVFYIQPAAGRMPGDMRQARRRFLNCIQDTPAAAYINDSLLFLL